ncbi:MAG: hypothetical protein GXY55_10945 [Phycisphaerae bacterium]|nr:hypothetical protein [Phycisphaerae bacterium]
MMAGGDNTKHTLLAHGRWTWHLDPAWRHLLDGPACPDWLALERDDRATLVKRNDDRDVWRVNLASRTLYAKISRPGQRGARLAQWWFGSPARREWNVAQQAARHGVETIRPVAWAEEAIRSDRPTSILLTLEETDAHPLAESWLALDPAEPGARSTRNAMIDVVARLVAHAHQSGFEHSDLHAGNVLLQTRGNTFRAVFVDLPGIRTGQRVSDAGVVRNLAQLNQWFQIRGTLTDRLRFLDRYLHWRDAVQSQCPFGRRLGLDRPALLQALERATHRHAEALYAKRDRRAMRDGRYFTRLRLPGGWRGHAFLTAKHEIAGSPAASLTLSRTQWQALLADPQRWVEPQDRSRVIKDSASGMICWDCLDAGDGRQLKVVYKRSRPRNPLKLLLHSLWRSRPMLTWRRANALLNRRIPTARPLAVLERRRLGLLADSFIITEYLEHARDLDTVLTVLLRNEKPTRQRTVKRQITTALVRVLRDLHDRGFIHRDLKAPNVMVQWNPAGEEPARVLLVDLDGLRHRGYASPAWQRRALMRLNISLEQCRRVSVTDRLRFLQAYLARTGHPQPEWKSVWRQIAVESADSRGYFARQRQKTLRRFEQSAKE